MEFVAPAIAAWQCGHAHGLAMYRSQWELFERRSWDRDGEKRNRPVQVDASLGVVSTSLIAVADVASIFNARVQTLLALVYSQQGLSAPKAEIACLKEALDSW